MMGANIVEKMKVWNRMKFRKNINMQNVLNPDFIRECLKTNTEKSSKF